MSKKGFTLIEILSVIVVISVLTTLIVPTVINISNNMKSAILEEQLKNINVAIKLYSKTIDLNALFSVDNPLNEYNYFKASELIAAGYIKEEAFDSFNYDSNLTVVIVKKESDDFSFKLINLSPESCFGFSASTNRITSYLNTCSKDVVIPKTIGGIPVYEIGVLAFDNKSLTSLIIPRGITTLQNDAFSRNAITSLELPGTITNINRNVFNYNFLTSIALPSSITTVGDFAFASNLLLQGSATIDKAIGTATISPMAFERNGANGLTTITPVYLR